MKKTFLVLAAVAALGLLAVACSGVSPLAPVVGGNCPDFSGRYVVRATGVDCGEDLDRPTPVTVTQSGSTITICFDSIAVDGYNWGDLTGTIDCATGDFTASGTVFDSDYGASDVFMSGNFLTGQGTITFNFEGCWDCPDGEWEVVDEPFTEDTYCDGVESYSPGSCSQEKGRN